MESLCPKLSLYDNYFLFLVLKCSVIYANEWQYFLIFLFTDDKADKRSNYMPRCTACDTLYGDVIGKSGNMYISSSCTHVFCGFCISKDGKSEICPACNVKFLSFRRLYMWWSFEESKSRRQLSIVPVLRIL